MFSRSFKSSSMQASRIWLHDHRMHIRKYVGARKRNKSIMSFDDHIDKWTIMWEHEYNDKEKQFKAYLGSECCYDLVDKLSLRVSLREVALKCFRCMPLFGM